MNTKYVLWLASACLVTSLACKKTVDEEVPVVPAPTISSLSASAGAAGDKITLTGTNFTNASGVTFGGIAAASFVVKDASTIEAVLGTGGSGDVVVSTPGGTAKIGGFTFFGQGTI